MSAHAVGHMKLAAETIAAIYKERWQIEKFFKAQKQSMDRPIVLIASHETPAS